MVGVQQPSVGSDDAVAVVVRIVAEGDVEIVLHLHEPRHGPGGRAVHADFSVPVEGHEGEGRVQEGVHHVEVQAVEIRDGLQKASPEPPMGSTPRCSPEWAIASRSTTFRRSPA